jgi:hypothetical protein
MKHLGQSGGHRPLFAVKSLSLQADREQWTVAGAGLELGCCISSILGVGGREQIRVDLVQSGGGAGRGQGRYRIFNLVWPVAAG